MTEYLLSRLQLFADGGEGGEAADGSSDSAISGEEIPSSIPERARATYKKAVEKNRPKEVAEQPATAVAAEDAPSEKLSYADLIKSDDYAADHKAYMEKTIGDRLKKYKGIEARMSKADEVLELVAQKYGLDSASESFLDDLKAKTEADDSYYENYAFEHDISTDEARRVVTLERQVAKADAERRAQEQMAQEERTRQEHLARYQHLQDNAAKTKQQFPEFDLETELRDERFARLCSVNNDDTTAAYIACHWGQIIPKQMQIASQQAAVQTSNAIASGRNRPQESGLSSNASAVVESDFRNMNLEQLRAYAAEQRRKMK